MTTSQTTQTTCLIIDDSFTIRMSLRDTLVEHGYKVLMVDSGEEGLRLLQSESIDVVILDFLMPEMTGAEVLRRIKLDARLNRIPVLMLTTVSNHNDLVACLDIGADDFIVKPWDEQELLGRLRSMVRLKRALEAAVLAREDALAAALTDKLTGLPNRALFCDRLQHAILRAHRLADYHFAVLFLDFDRFKLINDSLGHEMGDLLLKEIANRLRQAVRSGDSLSREARERTSARLGGDEFVVLLDGIDGPDCAKTVADRLLEAFSRPYRVREHEIYSTASIGIVTRDIAAGTAEDVLRDADTAMYEAKLAGKGRYVVFDVSMRQRVQNRLNLENDLRKTLGSEQLFLMYQPIVSLDSGEIRGFEALVRWRHPQRGLISPAEFVPIAEETGQIISVGEWVLREACRQLGRWQTENPAAADWSMSVNVSRVQLLLPGLPETIRGVLHETGLAPERLHLEITESAVMQDVQQATQILRAIKDIGVKLDLDDFGTGYSSLSCLHQFPLDVLKIDRSFVVNIERGRNFAALIHAVASLARNLGISVVAEGIETVEQLAVLQTLECEFGQGYYFAKPMTAQEAAGFRLKSGVLPDVLLAEAACACTDGARP